jgi:hypothetical protein
MDWTQLTNLISSIGFPAVVCILLLKNNQEQANVIRDNTKVMQSLADKIDSILRKGGE